MRALAAALLFACGCGGPPAPVELRPILELTALPPARWLGVFRTARGELLVGRQGGRISSFVVLGPTARAEEELLFTAPDGFVPFNLILVDRGAHDDLLIQAHPNDDSCAEQLWRIDGATLTASLLVEYTAVAEPCFRVSALPGYALVLGPSAVTGVIFVGRDNGAGPTHLVPVDALDALAAEPCRSVACLRTFSPPFVGRLLQQGTPVAFERGGGFRLYGTRTDFEGHDYTTSLASYNCDEALVCSHVEDIAPVDWYTDQPAQVGFGPEPIAVALASTRGPMFTFAADAVARRDSMPSLTWQQVLRGSGPRTSRYIARATDPVRYRFEVGLYSADAPEARWGFAGWGPDDQYGVLIAATSSADSPLTIYSSEVEGTRAQIYRLPTRPD